MKKSLFICFLLCSSFLFAQKNSPLKSMNATAQKKWVDSLYANMSLDQKIGQLFMVDIFSSKPKSVTNHIKTLIKNYHIGGVIFSKGGPQRQAKLNNEYQELSKIPLLVGMDAEWGLSMRLDSTYAFPWNMTLGAIDDLKTVERVGKQIGKHNKRLGVHINFAPVVDINVNPDNPIIGNRSFGENKYNVTQKAIAFMKGMHSENILSSAKHFPGHGDTDVDSHKALPVLNFSRKRLDSIELYPYKLMIKAGVSSIMVGHLNVPALDDRKNHPSSISKPIITNLLKEDYNYKGLIFTDALNMRGISDYDEPGKVDLEAFKAGNDILLIPENVAKGVSKIKQAYKKGDITEARLQHSVKKILMAKYKVGLNRYKPVNTLNLIKDLNTPENDLVYEEAIEKAITLLKNNRGILPIRNLKKKVAYINLGTESGDDFYKTLEKYTDVDKIDKVDLKSVLKELENYQHVIIGYHKANDNPWQGYKFTKKELTWIDKISKQNETILSVFARPYALLDIKSFTNIEGVLMAYQNSKIAQEKTAQIIFGAIGAKGKLPVSIGDVFPEGTQFKTTAIKRLSYGTPESVGMKSEKLAVIDSLAQMAVDKEMTPGLQLVIARKGKVFYHKNFGYHTYKKKQKVDFEDVYDLASLTKILATLPMIMELQEKNIITMNTTLKEILPELRDTNKANISLIEMLSHYARLKAWIPFYISTIDEDTRKASIKYFRKSNQGAFSVKVADDFYMRRDIQDSIYKKIANSDLRKKKEYKYSDLAYYFLKRFIERAYSSSLDYLSQHHLYKTIGANRTGYLPLDKFKKHTIIPTEIDDYWREQTIQGYVHDQGAAMQGGIGGHAGVFSNANDVAKIMQMYLNGGYYGGKHYFSTETINAFNTCYYCDQDVRRGVGFDKPQLKEVGPTCGCVSMKSFGHTGFTGTYAWADPDEEIVYIFLSNRTFPDATNRKLISEDIRTKIQSAIYQAIE